MTTLTVAKLTIPAPAELLTLNRERTRHWSTRAEITRQWRNAAYVLAKVDRLPAFQSAEITFDITQARGQLADAGSHHPVTKAILDGIVQAGVLPDDDPAHVLSITEHAPTRGPSAVTVTLKGAR